MFNKRHGEGKWKGRVRLFLDISLSADENKPWWVTCRTPRTEWLVAERVASHAVSFFCTQNYGKRWGGEIWWACCLSFTDVSSSNSLHKILGKRDGEKLVSLLNILLAGRQNRKFMNAKEKNQQMRKFANIVGLHCCCCFFKGANMIHPSPTGRSWNCPFQILRCHPAAQSSGIPGEAEQNQAEHLGP